MEWVDRLPLIQAIVAKDVRGATWWWIASGTLAAIGFFVMLPSAIATASYSALYRFPFVWYDSSLRAYYGLAALLTSAALAIAFSYAYTGEVRRGTIRSIILYPVDMDDVILSKLASTFVIALASSLTIYIGFLTPLFLYGILPVLDFLAIFAMAFLMGFVALGTGVFLSLVISHMARRVVVSPSTMGGLFLLFAILLTEQVVYTIGTYFLILAQPNNAYPTPQQFLALSNLAKALSVLSPQHMGARILGDLFGIGLLWPDVQVVIPVAVIVVFAGYSLGKKLYLDVFMQ